MGRTRTAQSMVEIALMLPVLALLIVAALDFSRVYVLRNAVVSATKVAVEYASTQGKVVPEIDDVCKVAREELGAAYEDPGVTEIRVQPNVWPPASRDAVVVEIKKTFYPVLPVLPGGYVFTHRIYMWRVPDLNDPNALSKPFGPIPSQDQDKYICSFYPESNP